MAEIKPSESPEDRNKPESPGPSALRRGLAVLRQCAGKPGGATFTALRRICGNVPPTTLARILKPLQKEGMICKDPATGHYLPGNSFIKLAQTVLGGRRREEIVQPLIDALAQDTGESAAYYEWDGEWLVLLAKAEQPESYHYIDPGVRHLHRPMNSFFRVCQAYLSREVVSSIFKRYSQEKSETEKPEPGQLASVRKTGVLTSEEPVRGMVTRISAPVFLGEGGECAGAVGITTLRVDLANPARAELEAQVTRAAKRLTHALAPFS